MAGVQNGNGARFGCSHGKNGFSYGLSGGNGGKIFLGAHDVANGEQKSAADGSSGVTFCIVFKLEPAGVEKNHGEGIAECKGSGGAGGGCHVKGTGFFRYGDIENEITVASKGTVGSCGEGDDGNIAAFNRGDQGGYFFRGARVTHGDEKV